MASLNHAPPRCVTSVGRLPSLNLSVQKQGRSSKRVWDREEAGKCEPHS